MTQHFMENEDVRNYWEKEPCGTGSAIVGHLPERTREWFERIEHHRYSVEPFVHSVVQFTRYHGKKILEIGVGAGTDHLQWARAGAECHGVDLTDVAIEITTTRLSLYGFESDLRQVDAEQLPFGDETFDVVYSWGVIHHSAHPELIVQEIRRVLKLDGKFIGMVYHRRSVAAFTLWIKYGLLQGRPWRSLSDIIRHHVESKGTKAYSLSEVKKLFGGFTSLSASPMITQCDRNAWPIWLSTFFPDYLGWFISVHAVK